MREKIGRTLFWFYDADGQKVPLILKYFSLGTLLNRLLNEKYEGRKIQFINLDFSSEESYRLHPQEPKNTAFYYGGHLRYYGVIDFAKFDKLTESKRKRFLWDKSHDYLQEATISTKNNGLLEASTYAYQKGLEINLNPDYRMVEADVVIYGVPMKAAVWVNFKEDGMHSKLTLEKDERTVFEKEIDKTKNGVEFFLVMYKLIEAEGNTLIVKGDRDVDYLPLKVPIDPAVISK
jgi:hypothetical protein